MNHISCGVSNLGKKVLYIISKIGTNQKYVITESHAVRLFQKEKPRVGELTLVQ